MSLGNTLTSTSTGCTCAPAVKSSTLKAIEERVEANLAYLVAMVLAPGDFGLYAPTIMDPPPNNAKEMSDLTDASLKRMYRDAKALWPDWDNWVERPIQTELSVRATERRAQLLKEAKEDLAHEIQQLRDQRQQSQMNEQQVSAYQPPDLFQTD
jgi:hypothetical protein